MYKDKDSDGGLLHMGPVWDFNLAFGNANYCGGQAFQGWGFNFGINCPDDFWQLPFWWDRMREDPVFQQLLADRWRELRNGSFSNDNLNATIDSLANELGDAPARNFDRWPVLGVPIWPNAFVGETYQQEVDYLKQWVVNRAEWMDAEMPGLTPVQQAATPEELRIFPNPTNGVVRLEGTLADELRDIRLYNFTGQLMLRRNGRSDLNLENLPAGIYVLQGRDTDGRLVSARVVRR